MTEKIELSEYESLVKREMEVFKDRELLEDELLPIANRLRIARGKAHQEKKYADASWFADTQLREDKILNQIRKLNIENMSIQRRLGELRRIKNHSLQLSERAMIIQKQKMFVSAAKDLLSEEDFQRIWQTVEYRIKVKDE